jgi:Tfp pilus assembly protein PilF
MGVKARVFKCIVAAGLLAVGYSLPAVADAQRLADLLGQLQGAENRRAADLVMREIEAEWSRSGSPTVDLLLQRGIDALEAGDFLAAAEHLTAAIDHAPDFAEAYNQRSAAYYRLGQVGPALDDLRQALVLNPDHLGALIGFAVILRDMDDKPGALEVFQRVLDMNPQDADLADAVAMLERELTGRAL